MNELGCRSERVQLLIGQDADLLMDLLRAALLSADDRIGLRRCAALLRLVAQQPPPQPSSSAVRVDPLFRHKNQRLAIKNR